MMAIDTRRPDASRRDGSIGRTRTRTLWDGAAILALVVGLVLAFTAPPDRLQGDLQRLMYVHVPAAWTGYLAFVVTAVASVQVLRGRSTRRWDTLAEAAAEVGVLFTALTLATGSIWGRPVWGVWWTWDARLVTTALLLLVYLAYLWPCGVGSTTRGSAPGVPRGSGWWRSCSCRSSTCRSCGGGPCTSHRPSSNRTTRPWTTSCWPRCWSTCSPSPSSRAPCCRDDAISVSCATTTSTRPPHPRPAVP